MERLLQRFNRMMNISIAMVSFDIIVGLLLFLGASFVNKVNAVLLGCLLLVHGLFQLIRYFYEGLEKFFFTDLILSIVGIVAGLFSIFNPTETITIVGILFGIWMIIYGLERLYYALRLMKNKVEIFPLLLFISVLLVVMGILILFHPFRAFMLLTKLIGLFILVMSILDVMTYSLYKKRNKELLKLFE